MYKLFDSNLYFFSEISTYMDKLSPQKRLKEYETLLLSTKIFEHRGKQLSSKEFKTNEEVTKLKKKMKKFYFKSIHPCFKYQNEMLDTLEEKWVELKKEFNEKVIEIMNRNIIKGMDENKVKLELIRESE